MSVSETDRLHLFNVAREKWDEASAGTLMSLLPDPEQLATKSDISELRTATKSDISELRTATKSDISELRTATKSDISELRAATKLDLADVRGEIRDLRAEMAFRLHENTRTILLANFAGWLTLAGLMVGLRFS